MDSQARQSIIELIADYHTTHMVDSGSYRDFIYDTYVNGHNEPPLRDRGDGALIECLYEILNEEVLTCDSEYEDGTLMLRNEGDKALFFIVLYDNIDKKRLAQMLTSDLEAERLVAKHYTERHNVQTNQDSIKA